MCVPYMMPITVHAPHSASSALQRLVLYSATALSLSAQMVNETDAELDLGKQTCIVHRLESVVQCVYVYKTVPQTGALHCASLLLKLSLVPLL